MARVEKTVFISYRRANAPWALAIYQYLVQRGYDVFFDYEGIASGDFETVILENIKARAHFVILLTPSALERSGAPDDWLRREIEMALVSRRNIVPIMLEGFDFSALSIAKHLTGTLAALKQYNALRVPADFFTAAMERLHERFLNIPLDAVRHPAAQAAQAAAVAQQAAARAAPVVLEYELTAQEWYERAFATDDPKERIRYLDQAVAVNGNLAEAYRARAAARAMDADLEGALRDYTEAIQREQNFAEAYHERAAVRGLKGDLNGALMDYEEAIRFKPDKGEFYHSRGYARLLNGDLYGAITDYTEAIRLNPDDAGSYFNRGFLRAVYDRPGAIDDLTEAIRLKADYADAHYRRGLLRQMDGDIEGALDDFTRTIEFKGDYASAYYARGLLLATEHDSAAAIADLKKSLDLGDEEHDPAAVKKVIRSLRKGS